MVDLFFMLVRSGLYGTDISGADLPSEIDWRQLRDLCKKQTLEGVVADAVMRLPPEANVPSKVKQKFMDKAFKIAKSHSLLDSKVAEIVKFFQSQDIPSILLKGQGIARCYRNPLMRQCGDIDLYVGIKNYQKACRLAEENLKTGDEESKESEKHYEFDSDHVSIELHRIAASATPLHKKEFLQMVEEEIEKGKRHIIINGQQVTLPSPLFDAFFIFYHAWRHLLYFGIGLRQLCDWTMLLDKHYHEIDQQALERILRQFQLYRPWQVFGNIAVDYLGLDKEKMPFYNPEVRKQSQQVVEIILECGNFGNFARSAHNRPTEGSLLYRKWKSFCSMMRWYTRLIPIFPAEATLKMVTNVPRSCFIAFKQLLSSKK